MAEKCTGLSNLRWLNNRLGLKIFKNFGTHEKLKNALPEAFKRLGSRVPVKVKNRSELILGGFK